MPTFISSQVPPPANWQDFETLCCDLWKSIWKDPNTKKHGRRGQAQQGVDIYGKPDQGKTWAGVQCRKKDLYGTKCLTEDEVRAEVEKAKSFEPKLSQFTIATTGQKDAKIEKLAREITEQHAKNGLFSVHVWAWEDIKIGLADFPELIQKHYPGLSHNTEGLEKRIDEIKQTQLTMLRNGAETKALVSSSLQQMDTSMRLRPQEMSEAILTSEYQRELDYSRDLLKNYKPREALEFLEKLKDRIWLGATSIVKYRLLTYSGGAKLAMEEEHEAGKDFLEALQYNEQDEAAVCNAALGYTLIGELEKAKTTAYKVLEKNCANSRAYSIIIQASSDDDTLEQIVSRIPEPYRNSRECAFAIADQARKRGKPEEAKKWLETAIENDTDDLPELKAALGETLLSLVLRDPRVANAHLINDSEKETIKKAVQLLTEAWERVAKTDVKDVRLGWIVNRGIGKGLLDDSTGAVRDIESALDADPSNAIFIKYRAMLARENDDNPKAICLLKKILDVRETPEASLLLVEILLEERRPDEAITVVSEFLEHDPPAPLRRESERLLIRAYIDSGDFDKAQKIYDTRRAPEATSILTLIDAARISKATGKRQNAVGLLKEATKYVSESSTFMELYELGNELYSLEHYEDAAAIYERIADKSIDGPLTRRLLNSYYGSGDRAKALEMCQTLRKRYGPSRYVSEMESAIYEEIGDLTKAQEVCKEYLGLFPDDFEMKLRLAVVNFHSSDFEELDNFLKSPIDPNILSLEAGVQIAYLCEARGLGQKSLEIMYEMRRKFFNTAEAHLKYVGFLFQKQKDADRLLNIEKILVDTAVCIEDTTHRRDWYIIEDRQDADVSRKEINLDHPLAHNLLGKAVKEKVVLKETEFGKESGKIVAIKSKYVYALHESLSSFSKLFPGHDGLVGVKVEVPEKRGQPPRGFEPILEQVSIQHGRDLKVEQFYKEGILTIGAFANLVGRNVLEVWAGVMDKPELGLRCCLGNVEERNHAISLLAEKPRLVVDIISLMTLHGIDAGDIVVKAFGKLGIAQSTIDFFRDTISERKGIHSRGFMTIGKDGDKFVKQEISSEDVKRNVEYLEGILEWVRNNCDIIPCLAALSMKKDYKQQLDELTGQIFVDTVLVAGEPGNLLYSDDERLRSFAKAELKVEGVWTQVLLMHCLNIGILEKSKYNEMIVKLVCSHYYHTSIDAGVLVEAARQSKWSPSLPYTTVLKVLSGKSSDESSALIVGTNFLYELWKQPILAQQRDYLILSLLDAITTERKSGVILDKLIRLVKRRFLLMPLAEKQLMAVIGIWQQTHII